MRLSPGIEVAWALEGEGPVFFRNVGECNPATWRHIPADLDLNAAVETSRNCADVRNNCGVDGRRTSAA